MGAIDFGVGELEHSLAKVEVFGDEPSPFVSQAASVGGLTTDLGLDKASAQGEFSAFHSSPDMPIALVEPFRSPFDRTGGLDRAQNSDEA